jgi:hypothetical protein
MGGAFRGAITGTGFYGIGRGFARISKGISGNFKSYSPRIKKSPTYNGTKKPMLKINLGFFGEKSSGNLKIVTNKHAMDAAKNLGYAKTNYTSQGRAVFKKGNKYITRDIGSHNGGIWKMADSEKNLSNKETRMGTYDHNLERIGD